MNNKRLLNHIPNKTAMRGFSILEFLVASLSHSNDGDASTEVNAIKTRLNGRITGEYGLGNVTILYPGASYGVVIVDPHCTDEDSALRTADLAMYQDKKGKNKTGFVALD